jgi:hypothetical protein
MIVQIFAQTLAISAWQIVQGVVISVASAIAIYFLRSIIREIRRDRKQMLLYMKRLDTTIYIIAKRDPQFEQDFRTAMKDWHHEQEFVEK